MGEYSPRIAAGFPWEIGHWAVFNFAIWFAVIAGLTLLAVALGALLREVRYGSRETPFRPA